MVIGDLIPVLWLCGPPGVGKSTVGWEIFAQLTAAGIEAGYVDIDQLGMCYPESVSDPGRHRMKAQNLGAVVANYRAAGARCVIVSGVAGPGRGLHAGLVPRAAFTVCRLGVGRAELKQRFLGRGGRADMAEEVLRIDTDRLTVEEAADVIAARTGWPGQPGRQTRDAAGGLG